MVFEKDYQLYLYDVASKKCEEIAINIYRNNVLEKSQEFDVKSAISSFDHSPDGNKLVFISHSEVFVSDAEGKYVRKMEREYTSGSGSERALEVK